MTNPRTWSRIAGFAVPAAIALTGLGLVAVSFSIHRSVTDASATLIKGQAQELGARIAFQIREVEGQAIAADIYEELRADGLTYFGFVEKNSEIVDQAGTSVEPSRRIELREASESQLREVAERVRVTRVRMGRRGRARRRARERLTRWRGFVFEFEPRPAQELRAGANRLMAAGGVAGVILLLVAIIGARQLARRERLREQQAHARRLAQLGEMSAVLAHELRNPLASLKGNAELAGRMLEHPEKAKARLERVVSEANRLEALTNDLLEFARRGEISRSPCSPLELLEEAAGAITGHVAVSGTNAPAEWSLDRGRIRQVLLNLLDNALQASPDAVEASVSESDGKLIFLVRDRGPGIPEEDFAHLFEAFYTKRTRGTGLGLAVSQRLVELHGGDITAANRDDGGAEFRVSIPQRAS